ncbi:brassinosteroid LRR receptor kinase BRI1 isoform X2 [Aegilops tauschii subsp. strangulata]|uniref:brassinosteroid LRR receptor kinase BRI1 isoform X2 n=1 Tax=Aegilops tauschii subsp. strangulata TaxID=200361 RepID=UPI00098A436B|nr:brassinosteroid LRR receptor kinase BRI1 isoform X2 [Aegilops tauschii subsp. strangulata]
MGTALCLALAVLLLLLVNDPVLVAADDGVDEQLLERFKAAVRNHGELGGWTRGDGACSFPGAACVRGGKRLVSLSLSGVPLDVDFHTVAGTLLRLGGLEVLRLRGANISGSLASGSGPGGWWCSQRLAQLDLSGNGMLGGSVADVRALAGACDGLRELNLSGNALVGGGNAKGGGGDIFARLDVLDLSDNNITGDGDLSWMGGVRRLNLAWNSISGPLQVPAFTNCSRMESLDLSGNLISGEVLPGVLSGCTALVSLNLSSNHLKGAFPPDITLLASLSYLNLSNNNFSGRLANLRMLDFSSNELSGAIPSSLCPNTGSKSKLEVLYLQNNYFTGGIPATISNCESLESLDLSLNYINGSIPTSVGSLARLRDLILWENKLEGEIPVSLGGALGLEHLILEYNTLTGSIPSELMNCRNLKWIALGSNRLSGSVPAWLGRLDNLAILKLNNNSFSGRIPPELGDCKSLIWLDLNDNQLSGSIPPELARQSGKVAIGFMIVRPHIYLRNDEQSSKCRGAGSLLEIGGVRLEQLNRMASKNTCNFTRVYILDSGEHTLKSNGSIIFLDLSFNKLDSEIPKELGKMNYLAIMNLRQNRLSGAIPAELAGSKNLGMLDLSHNQLEGPIPSSFSLLSLSEIDLSYNRLNGPIPEMGSLATFPESQYANNSGLCGFPLPPCQPFLKPQGSASVVSTTSSNKYNLLIILLSAVTLAFVIIVILLYCISWRNKVDNGKTKSSNDLTAPASHQLVSHLELVRATGNFSEDYMLGYGGHGKVFKGQLSDGLTVAIKVLDMRSACAIRSFEAECRVLRMARHRNLIRIITTCSNMNFRALVLQYMPNGNLETLLHCSQQGETQFGFRERLCVMLEVSMAMEYLHHGYQEIVLHCDLKPSNVLFDEDMMAHVADFGIARLLQADDNSVFSINMHGTIGYMSPEYGSYGKASRKSDVFSYGIMLLEVFTGKRPTDAIFVGELSLRRWVHQLFQADQLVHAIDRRVLQCLDMDISFLVPILEVGLLCSSDSPEDRITMSDVVLRLKNVKTEYTKHISSTLGSVSQ